MVVENRVFSGGGGTAENTGIMAFCMWLIISLLEKEMASFAVNKPCLWADKWHFVVSKRVVCLLGNNSSLTGNFLFPS